MKDSGGRATAVRFWLFFLPVLLAIPAIVTVHKFQAAGRNPAVKVELVLSATYSHGLVDLTIPYRDARAGAGQLTVDILDPEDHVIGHTDHMVDVGRVGQWREQVKLATPLAVDDLAWHRVRYRFAYSDGKGANIEGIESISQILRMPVIHILGQQTYLAGGQASVRVIVTDSQNEVIAGRSTLRIELLGPEQKSRLLFRGRLNHRGTTEAQLHFPPALVGSYQLHYLVDTSIGSTEFTQSVRLEDKVSILLTTEKPIYQPGQTIHARAGAGSRES